MKTGIVALVMLVLQAAACSSAESSSSASKPSAQPPAPTAMAAALTDAERMEIARGLFAQYLEGFKGAADPKSRLLDYRIEEVRLDLVVGERAMVVVYSVLPSAIDGGQWVAGNGVLEGSWIARNLQPVDVVREDSVYRLRLLSVTP